MARLVPVSEILNQLRMFCRTAIGRKRIQKEAGISKWLIHKCLRGKTKKITQRTYTKLKRMIYLADRERLAAGFPTIIEHPEQKKKSCVQDYQMPLKSKGPQRVS